MNVEKGKNNYNYRHFILAMDDSGSMDNNDGQTLNRWDQLI